MTVVAESPGTLTPDQAASFDREGYLIVPGLLNADEVRAIREKFDAVAQAGQAIPNSWDPKPGPDPLTRYPRVMQPHRWDELSKRIMLHPAIHRVLAALLREEPVACQSMFYFKPPGARGQALHQDNFYLQVQPETCIAAWIAIDRARPENGGLYIVPRTQGMEILCPDVADASESFTTHLVNAPKGLKAVPAVMESGDVLFFNGSVIHGSGPNRSATEWRRAFICHYFPRSSRCVARFYFPVLDFAGREVNYDVSAAGGPCGIEQPPGRVDPYGA